MPAGLWADSFDNISYTYDENGIRASKTVGGKTTYFYVNGSQLFEQVNARDCGLHFFYDRNGELTAFARYYEDDEPIQDLYYYVKNAQGDVTDITDEWGNIIASYTYDPWGKITSISGTNLEIANLNPFRYRSYYYDSDIEMYYLQSRYYDPEVGRFINADDVNYIGITESEISYNPFTYCKNNFLNLVDLNGKVSVVIRHTRHYIYVYKYTKPRDFGHIDISIEGGTYSYGTDNAGMLEKIRGKAKGCLKRANTSTWLKNMKNDGYKISGTVRIGVTDEEYILIFVYLTAFINSQTKHNRTTKSGTIISTVVNGKYSFYSFTAANCSTFVRDILNKCLTGYVISRCGKQSKSYTPGGVFNFAKRLGEII